MFKWLSLITICLVLVGCFEKKIEEPTVAPRISPGPPRFFDVGDQSINHPLPEEVADGFLAFGITPGFSYGLNMAHKDLSQRSHDRSDMLIYIHSGYGWFHVGAEDYWVSLGDAVYVPRGAIYSLENKSVTPIQLFTVYSPPLDPDDVVYHNVNKSANQDTTLAVDEP